MRTILGITLGLLLCNAAGAREVSIAILDSQTSLTLVNPSTVTVTYDVYCHKPDGTSLSTLTSQTLAPKAKATHTAALTDSGKCASNANPVQTGTDANGKPFYYCAGSNAYAGANNACGTGNSFCFPDISGWTGACSCSTFWLKNDGSEEFMPACGGFGAVSGGNQVGVGNYQGGSARKSSAVGPCAYFGWAAEYPTATTMGSVCCSTPIAASLCKIVIQTADPAAHLSSPSFMGGAAF